MGSNKHAGTDAVPNSVADFSCIATVWTGACVWFKANTVVETSGGALVPIVETDTEVMLEHEERSSLVQDVGRVQEGHSKRLRFVLDAELESGVISVEVAMAVVGLVVKLWWLMCVVLKSWWDCWNFGNGCDKTCVSADGGSAIGGGTEKTDC